MEEDPKETGNVDVCVIYRKFGLACMPDDILPSGGAEDAENKDRKNGTIPQLDLGTICS